MLQLFLFCSRPPTVPKKCRLRTVCVVHWRRLSCVFLFAVSWSLTPITLWSRAEEARTARLGHLARASAFMLYLWRLHIFGQGYIPLACLHVCTHSLILMLGVCGSRWFSIATLIILQLSPLLYWRTTTHGISLLCTLGSNVWAGCCSLLRSMINWWCAFVLYFKYVWGSAHQLPKEATCVCLNVGLHHTYVCYNCRCWNVQIAHAHLAVGY